MRTGLLARLHARQVAVKVDRTILLPPSGLVAKEFCGADPTRLPCVHSGLPGSRHFAWSFVSTKTRLLPYSTHTFGVIYFHLSRHSLHCCCKRESAQSRAGWPKERKGEKHANVVRITRIVSHSRVGTIPLSIHNCFDDKQTSLAVNKRNGEAAASTLFRGSLVCS
jgi:hypothetical protein